MATTNTKAQPTRNQSRAVRGWTLNLPAEEEKAQLNVNVPKSLLSDIELLKTHFNTTQGALVERMLRQALSTNADLQRLKASKAEDVKSSKAEDAGAAVAAKA
jgi:hypothetical protein